MYLGVVNWKGRQKKIRSTQHFNVFMGDKFKWVWKNKDFPPQTHIFPRRYHLIAFLNFPPLILFLLINFILYILPSIWLSINVSHISISNPLSMLHIYRDTWIPSSILPSTCTLMYLTHKKNITNSSYQQGFPVLLSKFLYFVWIILIFHNPVVSKILLLSTIVTKSSFYIR